MCLSLTFSVGVHVALSVYQAGHDLIVPCPIIFLNWLIILKSKNIFGRSLKAVQPLANSEGIFWSYIEILSLFATLPQSILIQFRSCFVGLQHCWYVKGIYVLICMCPALLNAWEGFDVGEDIVNSGIDEIAEWKSGWRLSSLYRSKAKARQCSVTHFKKLVYMR